jgi:threonine dehydratase
MPENPAHPAPPSVAPEDYAAAARRIAPYVRRTPLLTASIDGREVGLKLEHLQAAGVFKIRGALNALLARRAGGRPFTSVVTASGGNHGLGVATAARWLDIPATVYVPATVPDIKASRIVAAGAEVVKTGRVYADAERAAREFAAGQGRLYVHAYDDPAVVAGQGTLAAEIVADRPDCDVVAVPVGGGGLLAGVSGALAAIDRTAAGPAGRRVVGVEPEGCPTLHAAVEAGEPVDVGADSVAASALGAARIGDLALRAYRANPVGLALVSDKEIIAARDRLWEDFRLAVEPAAATVFAAWLAGQVPGAHPVLVLSGANATWTPA